MGWIVFLKYIHYLYALHGIGKKCQKFLRNRYFFKYKSSYKNPIRPLNAEFSYLSFEIGPNFEIGIMATKLECLDFIDIESFLALGRYS